MITVISRFRMPAPLTRDQARDIFTSTAPKYLGHPGLLRKYYFVSEDGTETGAIYHWETREAAEALYTDEWRRFVSDRYGTEPDLTYQETLVVVDNMASTIATDGTPPR